ncbi:MAG: DNA gyrase inhibitor YacG [Pseudomonadota bacterium]
MENEFKYVGCPKCGKKAAWKDNSYRPFCSQRCKLIDLGSWASEEYKIPTQERFSETNEEKNDE